MPGTVLEEGLVIDLGIQATFMGVEAHAFRIYCAVHVDASRATYTEITP